MNLRPSSQQHLASIWPSISETIDRVREAPATEPMQLENIGEAWTAYDDLILQGLRRRKASSEEMREVLQRPVSVIRRRISVLNAGSRK